ncbi:nuclear transport factor 2 family protein [Nocardioides pantholopis]|uniref:nuclear transport factor 2 family protein n=1 Tax=Nocardioides pantholopis TaxID=2483798 RepID=UPI000F08D0DE|nr:nuclear transport factor 2 family protein [Nocardioides pantholopis]
MSESPPVAGPIEPLVAAHLDAWNAPAGPGRDQAVERIYAADVSIAEPSGVLQGHDGMGHAISRLQAQLPGTSITRSDPIQVVQDLVTYRWTLGPPGRSPNAAGRDVLIVRDGRIASVYVVMDTP